MGVFDRFSGDGFAILMPDRLPGLLLEPPEFVSGPLRFFGVLALMEDIVRSVILMLLFPLLETEPKVESIVGVDDGHSNPPPTMKKRLSRASFAQTYSRAQGLRCFYWREGGDSRGAGSEAYG